MDQNQFESSTTTRKYLTAEQKFKIVKEHFTTKTGMTEICKKYGINATQFYRWQEQFFEGALAGFEAKRSSGQSGSALQYKIEEHERELKRRQDVILELAAEVVTLKKTPGAFFLRK